MSDPTHDRSCARHHGSTDEPEERRRCGRPRRRGRAGAATRRPPAPAVAAAAAVALAAVVALAAAVARPAPAAAQEGHRHGPGDDHDGHHAGLHFTHPLIAESVSPDNKVRLDHQFFDFAEGDEDENSAVLEAEYAFHPSFSIEAGLPYSYTESEVGNLEVALKFANYAFEDAGVLLGYGVEVGFPTNGTPEEEEGTGGDVPGTVSLAARSPAVAPGQGAASGEPHAAPRIPGPRFSSGGAGVAGTLGTDEWEVAPFLNVGFKRGPVELVAWGVFGIPFDQAEQEEVATELSWNFSGMYHVSSRVQALVELDGSGGISGEAVGEDVVNLSPGLRVQILPDQPLVLGTSVGVPLANEEPFDVRWKTSLFWHFPR